MRKERVGYTSTHTHRLRGIGDKVAELRGGGHLYRHSLRSEIYLSYYISIFYILSYFQLRDPAVLCEIVVRTFSCALGLA